MIAVIVILMLAPTLAICSGEGNIHLLENEVALVLKTCINDNTNGNDSYGKRDRRSNNNTSDATKPTCDCAKNTIDNNIPEYKNTTQINNNDIFNINSTANKQLNTSLNYTDIKANRTKRSEPLFNKTNTDQCLSQCVFANLQVIDSRGIPRETELWNLVQSSVTSQQSRAALRDQLRACFQELQTEAEDDGCSYSNKLERCLMLRFSDRLIDGAKNKKKSTSKGYKQTKTLLIKLMVTCNLKNI